MSSDYNKPSGTSTKLSFPTEIRDNINDNLVMHDGAPTTANLPVNAKRMDNATGEVFNWNGASWDSIGFISLTRDPVGDLVDGAPATLDTLNELAAAVQDDPAFYQQVVDNANDIAALQGESNLPIYISSAGSGDRSGKDASNRMTYSNFFSNVLNEQKPRNLYVIVASGSYSGPVTYAVNKNITFHVEGNFNLTGTTIIFNGCSVTFTKGSAPTADITFGTTEFNGCSVSSRHDSPTRYKGGTITLRRGTIFSLEASYFNCSSTIIVEDGSHGFIIAATAFESSSKGITVRGGSSLTVDAKDGFIAASSTFNVTVTQMSRFVSKDPSVHYVNNFEVLFGSEAYFNSQLDIGGVTNLSKGSKLIADAYLGTTITPDSSSTKITY